MSPGTKCRPLSQLSPGQLRQFWSSFDTAVFDCDGVLWLGHQPLPGAAQMIEKCRAGGKKVLFLSNNSARSRQGYLDKFKELGFPRAEKSEVYHAGRTSVMYLQKIGWKEKIYALGRPAILEELKEAGIDYEDGTVDVVPSSWAGISTVDIPPLDPEIRGVLLGYDPHFNFAKLTKAVNYLRRPDPVFLVTELDVLVPSTNQVYVPGSAAMAEAVRVASEVEPFSGGKPSPFIFECIKKEHPDVQAERTLMIGDSVFSDILFGKNCGLTTLLVGTGCHTMDQVKKWEMSEKEEERRLVPHYFADGLQEVLDLVKDLDEESAL